MISFVLTKTQIYKFTEVTDQSKGLIMKLNFAPLKCNYYFKIVSSRRVQNLCNNAELPKDAQGLLQLCFKCCKMLARNARYVSVVYQSPIEKQFI